MDIKEKVEGYFIELSIPFECKEDNLWVIDDPDKGMENVIVTANDQVVTITVNVMKVPSANKEQFYETLLNLNATEMIHGAYGINGDNVVLTDSLEGMTLDLEEIQASLDAISLALSQHYSVLKKYRA
jgi:ribosomal protein L24